VSTERLYYHDPYLTQFDAEVIRTAKDGHRVYLNRTAFYPSSGGQPFDTGELGGRRVIDVVDEGDEIVHVLDDSINSAAVTGAIDWTRRFDHMQQHTGQHLLSAVFAEKTGLVASNGEARRQIKGGGLKVNDAAVADEKMTLSAKDLTAEGVIKLSLGRKKHVLLKPV